MAELSDSLRASITELQLKHSSLLQAVQAYQGGSVSAAAAELRAATATVERILESNADLTTQALAVDASTRAARDIAKAARDEASESEQTATDALAEAEALLKRAEIAAVSAEGSKASAEAARDEALALVDQPALEADRAEAARDQAAITALGVDNDKLMSIASVYGKPSISLDFLGQNFWKQGKYPWAEEPAELTFIRSTPKWVTGPDGLLAEVAPDEIAYEYDPDTGEPLGILIEPSRTNIIKYSDLSRDLRYATGEIGLAPDGTLTARVFENEPNKASTIIPAISRSLESAVYTRSVFAKAHDPENAVVIFEGIGGSSGAGGSIGFDLIAEKFINNIELPDAYGFERAGNGWYRIWVTASNKDPRQIRTGIFIGGYGTSSNQHSVYVWGAQIEEGDHMSSFIPTDGVEATRGMDALRYQLGDEYHPASGTIVLKFRRKVVTAASSGNRFLGMTGTDGSLAYDYGTEYQIIRSYDNNNAPYVVPTPDENGTEKFALGWSNGTRTLASGTSVSSGSDKRDYESGTRIEFASDSTAMSVESFEYFPRRMTDAELTEVTS